MRNNLRYFKALVMIHEMHRVHDNHDKQASQLNYMVSMTRNMFAYSTFYSRRLNKRMDFLIKDPFISIDPRLNEASFK